MEILDIVWPIIWVHIQCCGSQLIVVVKLQTRPPQSSLLSSNQNNNNKKIKPPRTDWLSLSLIPLVSAKSFIFSFHFVSFYRLGGVKSTLLKRNKQSFAPPTRGLELWPLASFNPFSKVACLVSYSHPHLLQKSLTFWNPSKEKTASRYLFNRKLFITFMNF